MAGIVFAPPSLVLSPLESPPVADHEEHRSKSDRYHARQADSGGINASRGQGGSARGGLGPVLILRFRGHGPRRVTVRNHRGGPLQDPVPDVLPSRGRGLQDRKSTRLNSSHVAISYAVFCL